ncbi:hypothetical protein [Shinella zoogloeoides]
MRIDVFGVTTPCGWRLDGGEAGSISGRLFIGARIRFSKLNIPMPFIELLNDVTRAGRRDHSLVKAGGIPQADVVSAPSP